MKTKFLVVSVCIAAMVLAAGSVFAATPLYFLDHNNLPASGAIATWDGATAITSWQGDGVPAAGPDVAVVGGQKWAQNYYVPNVGEPWTGAPGSSWGKWTGFRVAQPAAAIPVSGATIVVAAIRGSAVGSDPWTSIVDIMYDKLTLGIRNDTGQICVRRNTSNDTSVGSIAVGQATVLSLTVGADGSYEVWADGISMMTGGAMGTMTEFDPFRTEFKDEPNWIGSGVTGGDWGAWQSAMVTEFSLPNVDFWAEWWNTLTPEQRAPYWGYSAPVPGFKQYINVGRNNPDGWTAFNGHIGDVKIFGSALSNEDRLAEVAATTQAMGMDAVPEPASILALLSGLAGMAGFAIRRKS